MSREKLLGTIAGHGLTGIALGLAGLIFWLTAPGNGLAWQLSAFAILPLVIWLMPEHRPQWLWLLFGPTSRIGLPGRNTRLRGRRMGSRGSKGGDGSRSGRRRSATSPRSQHLT